MVVSKRARPATPERSSPIRSGDRPASKAPPSQLQRVPIAQIDVPPLRIRRELGAIEELAYSVGSVGLLHPVQVYRVRTRYRLIAGERRLEAARLLGWTEIDAMVREPSGDQLLLELIENTQRKWLTDAEEADAFIRLVRDMGREAKEVAAQAGRSEAYVSKRIRVFEDNTLRQAVERQQLSVSVAEEFLALPPEERPALVAQAIEGGWDGRRARDAARGRLEMPPEPIQTTSAEAWVDDELDDDVDDEPAGLPQPVASTARRTPDGHPSDLARQARELTRVLNKVRPFDLTPADERALAQLMQRLLSLARAHAGPGRLGVVFPSMAEAEARARQGSRRR